MHIFIFQAAEDQARLLKEQSDIEAKHGLKVSGLSLFNTVLEVITVASVMNTGK